MSEQNSLERDVPADGFCPTCTALADEACHRPDGSPRENHKARRPLPSAVGDARA